MSSHLDPHYADGFRADYSRADVINPIFEKWKARGMTLEATRRRRVVSMTFDATTGHPEVTWEEETIDVRLDFTTAGMESLGAGIVGSMDGLVITADPLLHEDQLIIEGVKYVVSTPPRETRGLKGGFLFSVAGVARMELEE